MKITWLGHSSIKIESAERTIYIDPYGGNESDYKPCDLILVSQWHFDHCSLALINKLRGETTHLIATDDVASQTYPCGIIKPGETHSFPGIDITAIDAYPKKLTYREHPDDHMDRIILGFLIKTEGKSIYFTGDTKYFPEMPKDPDILLLPVGGTFTLTSESASKLAEMLSAKLSIPIHWGSVEGSEDNAKLFSELCKQPVKILKPGEFIEL